jgi:amino acid permease
LTVEEWELGHGPQFPRKKRKRDWFQKNLGLNLPEIESWPKFFVGCCVFCTFFGVFGYYERIYTEKKAARAAHLDRKQKKRRKAEKKARKAREESSEEESEEESDEEHED